jgi:hypothetical protein
MSRTLYEITEGFLLTTKRLKVLGERLEEDPRERIEKDRTPGAALTARTVAMKLRQGSSSPSVKLRNTGELANDITNQVAGSVIKVGLTNRLHALSKRITKVRRRGAQNKRAKNSDIGKFHNEGLGNPERPFLFSRTGIYKEEKKTIIDFIDDLARGLI